jgi:hypothetical protein
MSVNSLNTFLNIRDAHLRVVSGNVHATAMNIGGINVDVAHGLQSVTNQGNVTSNTLQFSNATTAFVTTANVTVGRDLTVTGNALVSSNLTVTGNVTVSDDLTVTENLFVSNNLTVTKDVTVTGNTFYTNPMSISVDSNVVAEYTGPHDRPLRKYPEVTMTSASQGGYVASQSTARGSTYYGWKAFDQDETILSRWQSDNNTFSSSSPHTWSGSTVQFTDTDGGTHSGEWIKLKLPKKIKLEHIIFKLWYPSYTPRDFVILGSNDDTNWKLLKTVADTAEQGSNGDLIPYKHNVNATTKYDYYVLLVSETGTHNTMLTELEYYGHEEGDSSLDTTLKSVYNVPGTQQLEVYYDAKDLTAMPATVTDLVGGDQNGTVTGHSPTLDETGGINSFVFDGVDDYINTSGNIGLGTNPSFSLSFWIYQSQAPGGVLETWFYTGSNTDNGRILIYTSSSGLYFDFRNNNVKIPQPSCFTWHHVTFTYNGSGTSRIIYVDGIQQVVIGEGTNYGADLTLVDAPIYIGTNNGGTSPFEGSIANFRLFSKALNAGQVQELYDYQKDYFLGTRSSVTLYKGHLGIGVAEPSGQLELAGDERIQEYPPRALTGYETLVEGHGVFFASMSNPYTIGRDAWKAFNKVTGNTDFAEHGYTPSYQYGANDGNTLNSYANPANNAYTTNGVVGLWIQLELPYEINLKGYSLTARTTGLLQASRMPEQGIIFGSNNGEVWTAIHNHNDTAGRYTSGIGPRYFSVDGTSTYRYFRLVTTKLFQLVSTSGNERPDISELRFYGTPGPTTLDKGSLSLGRSLDVPRISRYDVDTETPRPEKLLLDFDTTVNSSPTDISGQGNHGTLVGATYSAADKAFSFDGTTDYIKGNLNNTGDTDFTVSLWLKKNTSGTVGMLCNLGGSGGSGNPEDSVALEVGANNNLNFFIFSGAEGLISNFAITYLNRWVHIVATRSGNNLNVYLDGIDQNFSTTGTDTLQLAANTEYTIGARGTGALGNNSLNGQISNPKLYNVVLEPSEVQKLYRLGRTGRSMVISDTAVGIGKVPEAQLDVRGNLNVSSFIKYDSAWFYASDGDSSGTGTFSDYTGFAPWNVLETGSKHFTTASASTSGGYYTAPVDGIYHFDTSVLNYPDARSGISGIFFSVNDGTGGETGINSYGYNRKTNMPGQENMIASATFRLDEGDTVKVYVVNMDCYTQTGHAFFSGYLVTRI